MPQFDAQTYVTQIFWLLLCFGVLCTLVTAFLAPRIGATLSKRSQIIEKGYEDTRTLLHQLDDLKRKNQENFEQAKHDTLHKLHGMMAEFQAHKADQLQKFDEHSRQELLTLQTTITQQKDHLMKHSDDLIAHICQVVYYKLTGQNMDEKITQKLMKVPHA